MPNDRILGIEGGGTKTAWALVAGDAIVESGKLAPSNLRLTPSDQIERIFRVLPGAVDRVGVFLAGCATEEDRAALLKLARSIWPTAKIVAGSDRESGMAACLSDRDGIAVNAGTGSSVTGRNGHRIENAGGWGHILGDAGGAYFISIRALRSVLREYDLRRGERQFAANILHALGLNNFDELVRWAQTADKMEIASLAPVVFEAARKSDEVAWQIVAAGVSALVDFTTAVALRLHLDAPEVRLMGGMFEHQKFYGVAFTTALREKIPAAQVGPSESSPEVGAAWLAADGKLQMPVIEISTPTSASTAATEEANPKSENLDRLNAREIVELFVAEEKWVQEALGQSVDELARAIELAANALTGGGRIFYVGAGTSGRLGVLDAAEIPPTFGVSADLFHGIIAGGASALRRSIEGAEDDARTGALAMDERGVRREDVVIGISASGQAAFVTEALRRAHEIGAQTILLTSNASQTPVEAAVLAVGSSAGEAGAPTNDIDLIINLKTGPEIVTGSTRLKAGTATKVALNIISTGSMVRLGRVRGNLMIDLQPTNKKLRVRAIGLFAQLTGCDRETARLRLARADWNLRAALQEAAGRGD
ncbi:MAG TPA: N-acetylmuramic acid 6-phosphate etherase [Chthoniobacterales bacterium]|nr:N-acetylmuramic acid 6-phosphate etherase [Chthoniobacterales bacterium]